MATDEKLEPRDFPGHGILKCAACGGALVEHEMKPCPTLGMDLIHVASQHSRGKRPVPDGFCRLCDQPTPMSKHGNPTLYCSDNHRKQWQNQSQRRA